jgi:hypothetical protein
MRPDAILSEIRRAREAFAEKFGDDVRAMLADLRKRQKGKRSHSRRPLAEAGQTYGFSLLAGGWPKQTYIVWPKATKA